ncbi:hypothetical protein [Thermosinus carboxydivorans]|nr:hypothetical protein [Thermosinus carboxydivorans]
MITKEMPIMAVLRLLPQAREVFIPAWNGMYWLYGIGYGNNRKRSQNA